MNYQLEYKILSKLNSGNYYLIKCNFNKIFEDETREFIKAVYLFFERNPISDEEITRLILNLLNNINVDNVSIING